MTSFTPICSIDDAHDYITESMRVIGDCKSRECIESLQKAFFLLIDCLKSGRLVLCCGNGGSAADASHFAAELVCRFEKERRGMKVISLGTDPQIITAIGNDYSFDNIFSRQIESIGSPGDLLIVFSTSGSSVNCLNAAREAKKRGLSIVMFTGAKPSTMMDIADVVVKASSLRTAHIQEAHRVMYHLLCLWIESGEAVVESV